MKHDLRSQLMEIYEDHGSISPDLVVKVASEPDHPLHDRFEWDNAVAGPLWRREVAAKMLRSVRVTYSEEHDAPDLRAFYAVRDTKEPNTFNWRPLGVVIADPIQYKLVVQEMEREIRALRTRYGHLKEYRELMAKEAEGEAA